MDHYNLVQRLTGQLPVVDQARRLNDFAFELGWRPSDRIDIPNSADFATAHLLSSTVWSIPPSSVFFGTQTNSTTLALGNNEYWLHPHTILWLTGTSMSIMKALLLSTIGIVLRTST